MRALLCVEHGLPSKLVVVEVPDPIPGPGEAVIDVHAAGVNFPDALIIQNKYQFKPDLPFSPGSECAGIVSAVGEGVTHIDVGAPVIAFTGHGAFAEKVLCKARQLIPMPPDSDFVVASAFVLTYATSYHGLVDRAQLKAGETLLVLGASGGVGLAAIEIGKKLGARVIAAASTPAKLEICKQHGADDVINYEESDLKVAVKELTGGKGADVIYDPVGGRFTELALRACAWRGRLLVVGFAAGDIPKIPANLTLLKGCSVTGVFWGDYAKREPGGLIGDLQVLFAWLRDGDLKPLIAEPYTLDRAAEAITALMERRVSGKLVVVPKQP